MLRAVTFDWWGTIVRIPGPEDAHRMRDLRLSRLRDRLDQIGVSADMDTLSRAYARQGDLLAEAWARHVDLAPDEQVATFLSSADLDGHDARVSEAVADAFGGALLMRPSTMYPHVTETLRRLREAGYRIGLVSNTGRTWGRYLRRIQDSLGISEWFDARVFSDEERIRKPDPRIFQEALKRLRISPGDGVHVGDDAAADVAGAQAVGMRAIRFDPVGSIDSIVSRPDATIRDLAELPGVLAEWDP